MIFRKKYECYRTSIGTKQKFLTLDDKANQERALECDIKKIIEKYGLIPAELLNVAKEPLYLENYGESMSINEKLQEKYKVKQYFESLPAKLRKEYDDDVDNFYLKIKANEIENMIGRKIFTEEYAQTITEKNNAINEQIKNLENQIKNLKGEINNEHQTEKNINIPQMSADNNPVNS